MKEQRWERRKRLMKDSNWMTGTKIKQGQGFCIFKEMKFGGRRKKQQQERLGFKNILIKSMK